MVDDVTGKNGHAIIEEARSSPDLYIIKTHQKPLTDDPAIYVLRDGRSSIISFFHYLGRQGNRIVPMEFIIDGVPFSSSWSSHFAAWNPTTRSNPLFLRFENVTQDPNSTILQLSEFLQKPKIGNFDQSFEKLNALSPQFFGSDDDQKNIAEIKPFWGLFVARHGPLMRQIGKISEEKCLPVLKSYCTELEGKMALVNLAAEVSNLAEVEYHRFDLLSSRMDSFAVGLTNMINQMTIIEKHSYEHYLNLTAMITKSREMDETDKIS